MYYTVLRLVVGIVFRLTVLRHEALLFLTLLLTNWDGRERKDQDQDAHGTSTRTNNNNTTGNFLKENTRMEGRLWFRFISYYCVLVISPITERLRVYASNVVVLSHLLILVYRTLTCLSRSVSTSFCLVAGGTRCPESMKRERRIFPDTPYLLLTPDSSCEQRAPVASDVRQQWGVRARVLFLERSHNFYFIFTFWFHELSSRLPRNQMSPPAHSR